MAQPPLLVQEGKLADRHIFLGITRTGSFSRGLEDYRRYEAQVGANTLTFDNMLSSI